MVAARDLKDAASIRKNALFDVFHPRPIHANRNRILGLARHRAGVASNAFAVIDYEAVFHSLTSFADVIRRRDSTGNSPSYVRRLKRGVMVLSLAKLKGIKSGNRYPQ